MSLIPTRSSLCVLCVWNTSLFSCFVLSLSLTVLYVVAVPLSLLALDVEVSPSISSLVVSTVLSRMCRRNPDALSTPRPCRQASGIPTWLPTVAVEQQLEWVLHALLSLVGGCPKHGPSVILAGKRLFSEQHWGGWASVPETVRMRG